MYEVVYSPHTTNACYGDMCSWFVAFSFCTLKIYGHDDVRLINGGRRKWIDEGRPTTTDATKFTASQYKAKDANTKLRSFLPDVRQVLGRDDFSLVDVRSPAEFKGEISAPPEYANEGA